MHLFGILMNLSLFQLSQNRSEYKLLVILMLEFIFLKISALIFIQFGYAIFIMISILNILVMVHEINNFEMLISDLKYGNSQLMRFIISH